MVIDRDAPRTAAVGVRQRDLGLGRRLPVETALPYQPGRRRGIPPPRQGVLAEVTTILGNHDISIEAIIQKEPEGEQQEATVIMLTHQVLEINMNDAIEKIESLDTIHDKVTRIRMETLR